MSIVIVDIIKEVVEAVQLRWDTQVVPPAVPERPYYYHGHLLEIVNTLLEKGTKANWKARKFPCIMLIQDFDEKHSTDSVTATLRIIIACGTKQEIRAGARYDLTFEPTLYPLKELFFDELKTHRSINVLNPSYTKTDRLYWGTDSYAGNTANTATDFLDAIEISNLELNFLKSC